MRARLYLFSLMLVGLGWGFTAQAKAERLVINVVTSNQFPVDAQVDASAFDVRVFNLDAVNAVEQSFSIGLPNNKEEAQFVVEQRIRQTGQATLNQQLLTAYQPLMAAMRYQLDRIPAIIFDDRAVVYGVTDINLLVSVIEHIVRAPKDGFTASLEKTLWRRRPTYSVLNRLSKRHSYLTPVISE